MPQLTLQTPTGHFTVTETNGAITQADWHSGQEDRTSLLCKASDQIAAYFAGELTHFDLPLVVHGTEFQKSVCSEISAIPFGETKTYGDIARVLGAPAQAVGQGCGGNPIPLLIPCHRVLGATNLGGFSGRHGVESKVWLLRHEGAAGLLI